MKADVQYDQDDEGTIRKGDPLTDEMATLMGLMGEDLFGIDDNLQDGDLPENLWPNTNPGDGANPDDLVFPNQHLEHIEHGLVEAMKASGIDPALIHAFEETGLLISDENRHLISDEDMQQWEYAVNDYRQKHVLPEAASFGPVDDSLCWSCSRKLPEGAVRCMHCEAKVEDAPTEEDAAMLMELFGSMNPSLLDEIRQMALESESGEDFVNRLMVGECPSCDSDNTGNCENDPEIDDPCIGRCFDCSQLFCCDCDELFPNTKSAADHNCPTWEQYEEEF